MVVLVKNTDYFVKRLGNDESTQLIITTIATVDTGDTLDVNLADFGIATDGFLGIKGQVHSTANSIIIDEAPTTAVTAVVLTVTIGGTAANDLKRTFVIVGE